ncbi:uncharacterized protein LOC143877509 isoform X1 [Tasmannia lanceolata]|uniref:uncharacterized protein LOC143877509 isoform X1 n=1 Tax=Tasmannia lanceolata TaxID=3420 RepID=UPI004062D312
MASARQLYFARSSSHIPSSSSPSSHFSFTTLVFNRQSNGISKSSRVASRRIPANVPKASSQNDGIVGADDDGVSLGTMKLPANTDIGRFETLLFQWGNSLFQGANLPLPMPLKVDKIQGGVRLGFIKVEDGKTEECVHIDCLVFPATEGSGPIFRAIRNGLLKDQSPPGEERIMKSLLQALQRSVEIARI